MKKAGVWIDHRQAYIVFVGADAIVSDVIESNMEKHVRFTGHTSAEDGSADDQRDNQYAVHLNRYFDEIILHLGDIESILLFGPGEAKHELAKRLTIKAPNLRIVGVETEDKMTEPQIKAKVLEHFHLSTWINK